MAETIRVLIPEEKADERIRELGRKISEDYAGKQIHLICVLKGGVFFMCELAKRISVQCPWISCALEATGTVHPPAAWFDWQRIWMRALRIRKC